MDQPEGIELPSVHHVVFCVRPENQEAAADVWRSLGFEFVEIELVEEGLRVLLDWDRGIEVVAPSEAGGSESPRFEAFLAERGEGVWSVVVRVADVDEGIADLARHGVVVRYLQRRDLGESRLDEADLEPLYGMPVTLLATDRP